MSVGRPGDPPSDGPTFARIRACGVVPVVTLDQPEDGPPVGSALLAGGLDCMEITFRTDAAPAAVEAAVEANPRLLVGAGTILTVAQARQAVGVGAGFIVAPGYQDDVVDWCLSHEVPVLPGVMTPTEITRAVNRGLRWLKFFPAEASGGPAVLAALGAVFPDVSWVPTGGIGPARFPDYLRLPAVAACGGSWLTGRADIAAGDFGRITEHAKSAIGTVRTVRSTG
jgi:2-dehydro-3-deoxyphosphogluconate aldolase/(4S)-4-hydroxy-2-oxoglutarate aldolase